MWFEYTARTSAGEAHVLKHIETGARWEHCKGSACIYFYTAAGGESTISFDGENAAEQAERRWLDLVGGLSRKDLII